MKKIIAIIMSLVLLFSLTSCGKKEIETNTNDEIVIKVGMVCIGDENAAYDRNFYQAADNATKILSDKGINVEWLYTYNHPEGDAVTTDCEELAEYGCNIVFLNSYGQEDSMLMVAADHPDTYFAALTNEASSRDNNSNTINAFPSIYEGRYLAGIAAGCKVQEMIDNGDITKEEAKLGYIGAFPFAEVISGYSAFFLGARSVCPDITMSVVFVNSWSDATLEQAAAESLYSRGCVLISQHSDSTTPATNAEKNGIYHIGYNIDMSDIAPNASIISTRIDWTNYFVKMIESYYNGKELPQDYMGYGIADGEVVLTELNESIAAPGTAEAIAKAEEEIKNGNLHVFDTSTFTVNGEVITESLVDITGDFIGDEGYNAIFDGYYHESYFKSAPSFDIQIDGITLVN